jgi:ferrochelatase
MQKIAVVLMNLGAPEDTSGVKSFLYNLFYDRHIINLPNPWRYILAKFISWRRAPKTKDIYAFMGGGSPLVKLTKEQANKLKTRLRGDNHYEVFTHMRYTPPGNKEVIEQIQQFNPDGLILLPLYPQFSTATTASSFRNFYSEVSQQFPELKISAICCYPTEENFIMSQISRIKELINYNELEDLSNYRLLFSAHGLPESKIKNGDPYQEQIEKTAAEIKTNLARPELDSVICYQSRVGPVKWIGPTTEEEIKRTAKLGKNPIVLPIAFVSEHSETLVELDIEYKELATKLGIENFYRVPALGIETNYIDCLKKLCKKAEKNLASEENFYITPYKEELRCDKKHTGCLCNLKEESNGTIF